MYRLTAVMQQHIEQDLRRYHELFSAGRCSGWELEELVFRAIQSDNRTQHHARWRQRGHDAEADIRVRTNGTEHLLQIKSGKVSGGHLILSGYRLGRFAGDLDLITEFLNGNNSEIIAFPYRDEDDAAGRHHIYRLCYANVEHLTGLRSDRWEADRNNFRQTNRHAVRFSLHPTMSWQVWWQIPVELLELGREMVIE